MPTARRRRLGVMLSVAIALLAGGGCNRAAMRIPGASGAFPAATTPYQAKARQPFAVVVAEVVDRRKAFLGEPVGDTKWKSVETDPFWSNGVSQIVRDRLRRDLAAAGLFRAVNDAPGLGDATVRCELRAFCARASGFLFVRVAGMTSLHVTVERGGRVVAERTFGRVVTDADAAYTGSQVTTVEDAMKKTMADSLRVTMADVLAFLEADAPRWGLPRR